MRVMALDHGTHRVGVAISDDMGMLATPLEFIRAEPAAGCFARIKHLAKEKDAGLILVGMPRNMDGSYGPAAEKVNAFIAILKSEIALPVQTWDERLTSVQANRSLQQSGINSAKARTRVDSAAATILLQAYLDRQGLAKNRSLGG